MAEKPLNILLITSDQQHFSTLGVLNPKIKTPHLDDLARRGMLFNRTYCPNPTCSPSRSSIITGLYPSHHHCWAIGVPLPRDVPTVGEQFQEAGYATSLVGKAHFEPTRDSPGQPSLEASKMVKELDFWRNFHGPYYGFEHIEIARNHGDGWLVGSHYGVWLEDEKGVDNWQELTGHTVDSGVKGKDGWYWENKTRRQHHWEIDEDCHYTTWTADKTIEQLDRYASEDKPFFLWSSFQDPHPPYLIPSPWDTMYDPDDMELPEFDPAEFDNMPPHFRMTQQPGADFSGYEETGFGSHGFHDHTNSPDALRKDMAVYYGMISFMDQQIGRIMERLDQLGLRENTMVVFTSDHGHFIGHHGLIAKGPFHYADGIRVPFIASLPGTIPENTRSDALQSLVDLPATFLAAAGLEVPTLMQGRDQMPAWTGETDAVRSGVIVEDRVQPTKLTLRTYVTDRYRMTLYRGHTYGELFDLHADPEERKNLWDHPDYRDVKLQVMEEALQEEIAREPMRMPRVSSS